MRILLDECVDRRFSRYIDNHDVHTVPGYGWAGLKNGELLRRAQAEFDVFVTVDKNLPSQHDLARLSIAVIVLQSRSNRLADLQRVVPEFLRTLGSAKEGAATWVGEGDDPQ